MIFEQPRCGYLGDSILRLINVRTEYRSSAVEYLILEWSAQQPNEVALHCLACITYKVITCYFVVSALKLFSHGKVHPNLSKSFGSVHFSALTMFGLLIDQCHVSPEQVTCEVTEDLRRLYLSIYLSTKFDIPR